jgi:hypothetical protein
MNKKEKKITASEKGSQKKHGYINTAQALEKRGGGRSMKKWRGNQLGGKRVKMYYILNPLYNSQLFN